MFDASPDSEDTGLDSGSAQPIAESTGRNDLGGTSDEVGESALWAKLERQRKLAEINLLISKVHLLRYCSSYHFMKLLGRFLFLSTADDDFLCTTSVAEKLSAALNLGKYSGSDGFHAVCMSCEEYLKQSYSCGK